MSLDERIRDAARGIDQALAHATVPPASAVPHRARRGTATRAAASAALVGIIVAATALLLAPQRGTGTKSGSAAQAAAGSVGPYLLDTANPDDPHNRDAHWHAALGVYDCDHWMSDGSAPGAWKWPATTPSGTPARATDHRVYAGLHSHDDGIIHMEPYSADDAGLNATVGNYFQEGGWTLSDTGFTFLGTTVRNGDRCGADPAELRWWVNGQVPRGSIADYKLYNNDVVVVAFLPKSAGYPGAPPSLGRLPDHPSGATLSPNGPANGTIRLTVAPGGALAFAPEAAGATTGVYRMVIDVAAGGHTLHFDDASTGLGSLQFNQRGRVSVRVFFGHAGDFTFSCTVAGHRAAGMHGVIHVAGRTLTLEQALATAH